MSRGKISDLEVEGSKLGSRSKRTSEGDDGDVEDSICGWIVIGIGGVS